MNTRRSASVGALPLEKKHFVSRNESTSGVSLDVRCACQYFQCDSLLPERINPAGSRPTSSLEFHDDQGSFYAHERTGGQDAHHSTHFERDHTSARNSEKHTTWDQVSGSVDISFVEKYPELEETARSRGLVVRNISDADKANMRPRYTSVDRITSFRGARDPDTLSMRSGISLRRISRSPSKADLFVADINISTPPKHDRSQQRSVSGSRPSSNMDLTNFSLHHETPQISLTAPTPSPAILDKAPKFSSESPPPKSSPSPPPTDFRKAKPPMSTDYMRPIDDARNSSYHIPPDQVLPQNRPIDMSKLEAFPQSSTITAHMSSSPCQSVPPVDNLQKTVEELEALYASRNVLDIEDRIKIETEAPHLTNVDNTPLLRLEEETKIDIHSSIPIVDVDEFVKMENEKARNQLSKRRSPNRSQPHGNSTSGMNILPLPTLNVTHVESSPDGQLKSQHSPERASAPQHATTTLHAESNLTNPLLPAVSAPQHTTTTLHAESNLTNPILPTVSAPQHTTTTLHGKSNVGPVKGTSLFRSASYSSRLKSMFSSKNHETKKQKSIKRRKSLSPVRLEKPHVQIEKPLITIEKPSVKVEKSPSPLSPRRISIFPREPKKPKPIQIVMGSSPTITKTKDAEPVAGKVFETFSLKVDDMDQYCSRPTKPPQSPNSMSMPRTISSREDLAESEHASVDVKEAFAPVVIGPTSSTSFLAGNRTLFSSNIEMADRDRDPKRRSWSKESSKSRTPEVGRPSLISVPIMIGSSGNIPHSPSLDRHLHHRPTRTPSEQRPVLNAEHKNKFLDGRTQSQDRHRLTGSQENLSSPSRMTKTVSFNFDERKSRLSEFENKTLSERQSKDAFLERTYFSRDHDYEPIGSPTEEKSSDKKESPPVSSQPQTDETKSSPDNDFVSSDMKSVEEIQKDIEDRFFSSATAVTATTTTITMPAQPESHTEQDSQVTTETVHEVPAKAESRMKGFIASAQDRTRQMQAGFKTQAGKIKTKLRPPPKKIPSGSPKAQDRKRFKAPEFSKIKMPEIKRPDMSKLKDFKRPEFTKFNKPDMSKFKLPEKLTTIKLRRSKSFKENETTTNDETFGGTVEAAQKVEAPGHQKKLFEFNFGTYPRAFRRKKKPAEVESSLETATVTEATSVRPSTETQPSSSPQGDRGPGPVRSRWADKFSDVSYNDSEGSRYRRYGSEQESFERESSLERRMREDLEDTGSEEPNMGIMGRVVEDKQFAEFDEENRAIHEISNLRSDEFKRRPFVHQDSDLRSEDSKEVVGWTEKDIQKNKLLRKAELEAEASYLKYQTGEPITQETQSTASSGKKVVMEEIDDDEFFLRKRGVSEDNIDLRQYISNAIREGYDTPMNALQHVGETSDSHEYRDFDVPPPKPRRLHKSYTADNASQELETPVRSSDQGDDLSLSQSGHDFFGAPQRPQRKTRGRRKYSTESEEKPKLTDQTTPLQYFANDDEEEEEEDLLSPSSLSYKEHDIQLKDINISGEAKTKQDVDMAPRPQPPRRQKRHREVSLEKDSYINGFAGRSISNSFLQPADDVIVYRTEHEYHRTHLATPEKYSDGGSESIHQSRSVSNEDFADHSSRGAQSLEPSEDVHIRDKFIIDMMENDGYAVVRKEPIPKPTPPARRRKRFSRSPGERFATVPIVRSKRSTSPPQRPPPPRGYSLATDTDFPTAFVGKSSVSSERHPNYEDDYEEPGPPEPGRPESPRNLQSGEIINKMKYRPLPPPPRPPREKRPRSDSKRSTELQEDRYEEEQREPDEIDSEVVEVEVSTQTDPLPDDFVCEEFEITDDMKVIEPRRRSRSKTLEELLKEELDREVSEALQSAEDEQLARGLQRFREANQRSLSERSRASSQADRSRSHSRAQTPSAILIERQVSTPVQSERDETMVEAALIVRPIDDLELEEEELRREGLLTDSSQHSVSDTKEELNLPMSDTSHAASSVELDEVLAAMTSPAETDQETQQIDDETKHITRHYPHETSDTDRNILEMPLVEEKDKSFSLEKSEEEYRFDESVLREEPSKDAHEPYEHVAESVKLNELEDEQLGTPTTEPPLPPPRRKSTTAVESSSTFDTPTQGSAEKEQIVFAQSLEHKEEEGSPRRLGDREVECLREQGLEDLQVGQRTVSPIHETPTHSDELERISPHFEAKNIELPPGWIEDIVERIRKADLAEHLTTETQTSPQSSSEKLQGLTSETVPPPKPPRHKELDKTPPVSTLNADEQTQTDQIETPSIPTGTLPQTFPSVEYLQSLAPLAFYNLHRKGEEQLAELGSFQRPPHRHRHHEHKHSSSSSETGESTNVERVKQEHHRHADNQSITRAGRQFITACSLALARAINHLTTYVRGNGQNQEEPTDVRLRQVSSIVVLFIAITFSLLLYMLSGRSIHTHHWDYFNPPGNEGRPS